MKLVTGTASVDDLDEFLTAIDRIRDDTGAVVQVFDARYVVSPAHLVRAVELAERARDRGEEIARDPAVEILLYAAGRRQIDRALEMGLSEGESEVVAVVLDGDEKAAVNGLEARFTDTDTAIDVDLSTDRKTAGGVDKTGESNETRSFKTRFDGCDFETAFDGFDESLVREFFDISAVELSAVEGGIEDVVLERVALLDVEK